MSVKVAINGFGRIASRPAFLSRCSALKATRSSQSKPTPPAPQCSLILLKYDTAQGSFTPARTGEGKHTVEATDDSIIVDGKEIRIYAEKRRQHDCPWGQARCRRRAGMHRFLHFQGKGHRLTSTQAQRKSLFPLPQATTCPPSFTT